MGIVVNAVVILRKRRIKSVAQYKELKNICECKGKIKQLN